MTDPVLDALRDYERAVAPAYELIRRARTRLAVVIGLVQDQPTPAAAAWSAMAVPDEPNGVEYAVEAAIESVDGAREPAPETEPEAAVSPPGGAPPIHQPPAAKRHTGHAPERGASPSVVDPPAASALIECPECHEMVKPQGIGVHRRMSRKHREPAWQPAADAAQPPITVGGKERWVCAHCTAFFNSAQARDRHQATHRVEEPTVPTGGQRIRRTPPARGGRLPAEPSRVNGSVGAGQ